jgi:hypothetical protein
MQRTAWTFELVAVALAWLEQRWRGGRVRAGRVAAIGGGEQPARGVELE